VNATEIFGLQIVLSLIIYVAVALMYLMPRLTALPLRAALPPFLLFHAMRGIGLTFLLPEVTDPHVPQSFAVPAAYGDLGAAVLALLSLLALRTQTPETLALVLVWAFNIEGTADVLYALYRGTVVDLSSYHLGATWFIPTFVVPALLVAHTILFVLLIQHLRGKDKNISALEPVGETKRARP
jgi:hypothetical protein